MLRKEACLVTGAGGFIGSHLTEKLVSEGYRVRALVNYRGDGSLGWLSESEVLGAKNLEIVRGDVRDSGQMLELVDSMDWVFHLAALIGIPYSFSAPNSYVLTNVLGTQNLLEAARQKNVSAFIQTSTSEVYGSATKTPMDESHRLHPQSPYAASKVGADALALSYFHSFNVPVGVLRPFNTFGPRQSARAVIPTIIAQLIDEGAEQVRLGNSNTRRDFTFVEDTVAGFIAFARRIEQAKGQAINLGSGWSISIKELFDQLAKLTGSKALIQADPDRLRPHSSEVDELLSNNQLAQQLLDWRPARSEPIAFAVALQETIDWFSHRARKSSTWSSAEYIQ